MKKPGRPRGSRNAWTRESVQRLDRMMRKGEVSPHLVLKEKQRRHDFAAARFFAIVESLPEDPKARAAALAEAERWAGIADRAGDGVLDFTQAKPKQSIEVQQNVVDVAAVLRQIAEERRQRQVGARTVEVEALPEP